MASFRLPGSVCRFLGAYGIDLGTLCRATSPIPGSVGKETQKDNVSSKAPAKVIDCMPFLGTLIEPWNPNPACIKGYENSRSKLTYDNVIDQFDVETNPRYAKKDEDGMLKTYCNIFVWDVTLAMGAEIPHWFDGEELGASKTFKWLNVTGKNYGWSETDDLQVLIKHVNTGRPAVAADDGHIVVIRPDQPETKSLNDLFIAQAGLYNFNKVRLGRVGLGKEFNPKFYIHE